MWYIFTTKKEAAAYNDKVCQVSNFVDGVQWAEPRKHPTESKWAIKASPRVKLYGKELIKLDEGWFQGL